ncbi:MAG: 1,4-alpha-glucan branching protein GlgB [Gammaproteobacteria bacterium]|nr:1,4-alpha-glucan branching protein GlgB [Gammaproteobacteria bacterium]MCW8840904.1 1,4-alpha-glucan branching protein GlgB [Gammaproteobacteria bacterium]MCW8928300.1 1,4-alpha-glucan branching protein GlgB [Gammaproteobacteria bacterium]MCW8958397.1 1,4-alpha-glucan branching protein GlgB [Gammaproteobacteria bacterium]MCW8972126.1 1,4-alpha-glucan branching protein GlgB [Gammaproteobacteria bacterium]
MTQPEDGIRRLIEARHHDPFELLGRHPATRGTVIRVYLPDALEATVVCAGDELPMERYGQSGLFQWQGELCPAESDYRIRWRDAAGYEHLQQDPYRFLPMLDAEELQRFNAGQHFHAYRLLGAHCCRHQGVDGVRFAVWAPNAERVSVVGDFNHWDGRCHPMRSRGSTGVWELFIPELPPGTLYKFELRDRHAGIHLKTDPYGRYFELRPATAAVVEQSTYRWGDSAWIQQREQRDWLHSPMSIYELHPGSWQRREDGGFLSYRELAEGVIPHVVDLGFTHIELLPITEHPLDASWGYQTTGYFAPTSRFGDPDGLRDFIDQCHQNGIGVILDWVPAHFPRDTFALARFDGTTLYEHEDPRRGEHRDWGTLIFNYGRNEVKNFLLSSALYWLEEFHIDGLRVDAVASMLYLDYSRQADDWLPNIHGGNENLEAITFLREMNMLLHREHPGALSMAEESTSWPMVSRPVDMGGLGFSMKWNMGWMHDTLDYLHKDPIYRKYHQDKLTFGLLYAFSENFILPFSHDEVVHMKRSMLNKMPGDDWQRFANLRLLYTYMFTMPGKKLLFMGNEFAQGREWDHDTALEWHLYQYPPHHGVHKLLAGLNRLYRETPALHRHDFEAEGFQWLDCDDHQHSTLSYLRSGGGANAIIALNFTPAPHDGYRIGVPGPGGYRLAFNSDSGQFGGSDLGQIPAFESEAIPWMGQPHSIVITLPPLAGLIIRQA